MRFATTITIVLLIICLITCNRQDDIPTGDTAGDQIGGLDAGSSSWLDSIPMQDITLGAAASCPLGQDLSGKFPLPTSQLGNMTCVCYSLAYYSTYLLGLRYKDLRELSQEQLQAQLAKPETMRNPHYLCAQLNKRNPNEACNDVAVSIYEALENLMQEGFPSIADSMPLLSGIDDASACDTTVSSMGMNAGPTLKELYQVPTNIESLAGNLCSQTPIIAGIRLPHGFGNLDETTPIPWELPVEPNWSVVDHLLLIVGYAPEGTENGGDTVDGAFKLLNSQGPNWGHDGYLWVEAHSLITMMEQVTDADGKSSPIALVHEVDVPCDAGLPAPTVATNGQPGSGGVGGGYQMDFNPLIGASSYTGELGIAPFGDTDFVPALVDQMNSRVVEIINSEGTYKFRVRANKAGCPVGEWFYSYQFSVGDVNLSSPVLILEGLETITLPGNQTSVSFNFSLTKPVTGVENGLIVNHGATVSVTSGSGSGPYTVDISGLSSNTVYTVTFTDAISDGTNTLTPITKQIIVLAKAADTSRPTIHSDNFDSASDLAPGTTSFNASVTFSEAVRNVDNVRITADGGASVGIVSGEGAGPYTFIINGLQDGESYTVFFGSGITDSAGNSIYPQNRIITIQEPSCNPSIPDHADAVLVLPDTSVPADHPQNISALTFEGATIRNDGSADITISGSQSLNVVFLTPQQGDTTPASATELIGVIAITTRVLENMGQSFLGIPACDELDISTLKLWYDPYWRAQSTYNLIPCVDCSLPSNPKIVYEVNEDNNWKLYEDYSWTTSGTDPIYIYADSQFADQDLMMMLFRDTLEADAAVVAEVNQRIEDVEDWYFLLEDVPNLENYFLSSFQSLSRDNCEDASYACNVALSDYSPFLIYYLPSGTYLLCVQTSFAAASSNDGDYALLVTKNELQVPTIGAPHVLGNTTYSTTAAIPVEQTLTPETSSTFTQTNTSHIHWFKFDITN
jgi:hypothetical protein